MPYLLILRRNQDRELGIPFDEMLERFQTWTRSGRVTDATPPPWRFGITAAAPLAKAVAD